MGKVKKKCSKCNRVKGLHLFYKFKEAKDGHRPDCIKCHTEMRKLKIKNTPGFHRREMLRIKYNMTQEEYIFLSKLQGDKCAICKKLNTHATHGKLVIDHDHKTNKVRGLLCSNCNCALGYFKDDPVNMQNAIEYLEKVK